MGCPSSRRLTLFRGRPAFYPLDSLFALRRDDIGGGKNAEVIEDRVAKLPGGALSEVTSADSNLAAFRTA